MTVAGAGEQTKAELANIPCSPCIEQTESGQDVYESVVILSENQPAPNFQDHPPCCAVVT